MVKLNNNEVQDKIEEEAGGKRQIPSDYKEVFKFEISENCKDLIKNMQGEKDKETPAWSVSKYLDNPQNEGLCSFLLMGGKSDYSADDYTEVFEKDNMLRLELGHGTTKNFATYEISQKKNGGCEVEYKGDIQDMYNYGLLPIMSYVPGTLMGKFVDSQGQDFLPYMPLEQMAQLRKPKESDTGPVEIGGNRHFNNEIPFLSGYSPVQCDRKAFYAEKEGTVAQWKKDRVKEGIDRVRGKISGAVAADEVAKGKISGKSKREIIPEVGAEVKKRKAAQR